MNIHGSYFEIPTLSTLLNGLDRRLNPYRHRATTMLRGSPLEVCWTERAERAMAARPSPLIVEMQLYFTCVVKKRVLFHDHFDQLLTPVNDKLQILFRPVESESCDPAAFAQNFPVRRELTTPAAARLKPSRLAIDFQGDDWHGEFHVGKERATHN